MGRESATRIEAQSGESIDIITIALTGTGKTIATTSNGTSAIETEMTTIAHIATAASDTAAVPRSVTRRLRSR
jgi:hypothetical protein